MPTQEEKLFRVLSAIDSEVKRCKKCAISLTRTKTVFQGGNPMAEVVVVGEGPGNDENVAGKPFVGKSGELLDRILATYQLDRTMVYIMNAVKCQACELVPGWRKNRPPKPEELTNCADYFDRQMDALPNKRVIISFGAPAANRVIGRFDEPYPMWKLRGKFLRSAFSDPIAKPPDGFTRVLPRVIPLFASYHPSYLMRSPEEKLKTYQDFLPFRKYLNATEEEREDWEYEYPDDPPKRMTYERVKDSRIYGSPKDFQKDRYSEVITSL